MRKILLSAVALLAAVSAKAQGTWYAVTEGMSSDPATEVSPKGEETAVATDIEGAAFFITDGGDKWECKSDYDPEKVFTATNGKDYPKAYIQGGTNGMGALNAGEDGNLIPGDYKTAPGLVKDGSTSAHLKIVPATSGTVYVAAKYGKSKAIWAAKIANEELEDVDYSDLTAYLYTYEGLFIKEDGTYGGQAAAEADTYAALPLEVEEGYTYLIWVAGSKLMLAAIDFVTGEAPANDVWTVAGVTSLVGVEWDPTAAANDMNTTDGVTYTLVKEGVVLEKGIGYEFKVAKDHAWTESYGAEGGNAKLTVEETGTYTVTFTFNADTKEITTAAEKTGEAEIGEKTYSVIGTINGSWDTDTDMEKGADGVYTAVFENVAAGEYKFKVRVNHDWGENYGNGDDGDGNTVINVENDGSTVTVTFNPENKELKCEIVGGAVEPAGEVVVWEGDGSAGAVSWNGTYRFASEEKQTGEEIAAIPMDVWEKMKTTPFFVDLEGENPQIRVTTGWWDDGTVLSGNDIQPGNELLTDNGDGKWTLKVDLSTNATLLGLVDDHHLLFTGDRYTPTKIYFAEASAINGVKKAANAGAIYNVAGQKVSASYKGLVIKNGKKYIQK